MKTLIIDFKDNKKWWLNDFEMDALVYNNTINRIVISNVVEVLYEKNEIVVTYKRTPHAKLLDKHRFYTKEIKKLVI